MENSLWIFLILIASSLTAITVFFDNYIVDTVFKRKSPYLQKIVYAFMHVLALIIIGIFFPIEKVSLENGFLIAASGAAYSLALIPYYYALKKSDATAVEIFSQAEPIFCLIFGIFLLQSQLDLPQFISFILIMLAAYIVIYSKRGKEKVAHLRAASFATIASALWALSYVFFVNIEDAYGYNTSLFYILLGRAIVDLMIVLILKKERRDCFRIIKKQKLHALLPILIDYVLEISGDLIHRYGMLIAPLALASAVSISSELIFVFFFGIILTILWPKFGREKLTKKTIRAHLIAIVLLVIGVIIAG